LTENGKKFVDMLFFYICFFYYIFAFSINLFCLFHAIIAFYRHAACTTRVPRVAKVSEQHTCRRRRHQPPAVISGLWTPEN
jgi:hypothetical protein